MKNIVIFSMGTRGDLQPYIFLAQALIKEGYHVKIGTHPCWHDLIDHAGIDFAPVGPDIDIEYEAAYIRGKTKHPMLSALKTMKFVFNIIENSTEHIFELCKGNDLVIVSHSQMGATEAEALHIPIINVTLQTEMIAECNRPHTIKDKFFAALINPQMVRPYNKIRKKYSLSPLKSMANAMSPILNLIPISPLVMKPNPYWEEKNKMVGYWYVDAIDYQPSAELENFLRMGSKPIILALGAMSFESKEEKEKLDIFIEAFKATGKRALIQGFNKSLEGYELPPTILKIGSVPHSWLFREASGVIHHCGFGTSAATLIYGVPSIPIPHALDQFTFGELLYKHNVSTPPIHSKNLSVQKLIDALNHLDSNYETLHQNVRTLSTQIQAENGLQKAVSLINTYFDNTCKKEL